MIAGFNEDSPLICFGIVGDGCGGGRYFFVEDSMLKTYDPTTKDVLILKENIQNAISISKDGCIVTIKCQNEIIEFDLSLCV